MVIVYTSGAGHTAHYAQALAQRLQIEAYPLLPGLKLPEGTPVLYMGWVMAECIRGLRKARKMGLNLVAVAAVGMGKSDEGALSRLRAHNTLREPLFYLQGGYNPTQVRAPFRMMINMMASTVEKQAATAEDLLDAQHMRQGFDCFDEAGMDTLMQAVQTLMEGKHRMPGA